MIELHAGSPTSAPDNFPGNPNPPPQIPTTPAMPGVQTPSTSAGTGALPPSNSGVGAATLSAPTPSLFSVVETEGGGHDAYAMDEKQGPQKLFAVRLPSDDVKQILGAVGATYDKALGTYHGVPEETIKALSQGRPTPADYWKALWNASEADTVAAMNANLAVDGKLTEEQLHSANHIPTLKQQLAERPDMAWFGKGGVVSDILGGAPIEGVEHAATHLLIGVKDLATSLLPVAEKALAGGAAGGAAGAAVGAVLPPPLSLIPVGLGISGGMSAGAAKGFFDLGRGQVAAHWLAQGIPLDVVKEHAWKAGVINSAFMMYGFGAMSLLGKAVFLDSLLESAVAKRALANVLVKAGAEGGVKMGGVMAAQTAVTHFLNNAVAETARKPELLEDPATAAMNVLHAGLQGMLLGAGFSVGAAGLGAVWRKAFEKELTPEEKASPEGKKLNKAIKRAENPSVTDAMKERLKPAANPANQAFLDYLRAGGDPEKYSGFSAPAEEEGTAQAENASHEGFRGMTAEDAERAYGPGWRNTPGLAEAVAATEEIEPTQEQAPQKAGPASGQSESPSPSGSPSQSQAASEQPSREMLPSTQAGASSESSSSREMSIAENPEKNSGDLGPPRKPPEEPPFEGPKGQPPLKGPREYVPARELGPVPLGDPKLTAKEVLQRYSEMHNEWLTRGNQLVDEIKRKVTSELERQALFWYRAAAEGRTTLLSSEGEPLEQVSAGGGNKAILEDALRDDKLKEYHEQIRAALNLSPAAKAMAEKIDRYYAEAAATANEIGTVNSIVENYQSRLYMPEEPGEKVHTEGGRPLGQTTRHAKQRVFDTEFDAARYGKRFATTDAAEALGIYNHEMAAVNTSRAVADGLVEQGVASWKQPNDIPDGWAKVGEIQKQAPVVLKDGTPIILRYNLTAPEGLADGLRAISEPDWIKRTVLGRNLLRAQGTIKTGLLSWSLFHHFTFLMQGIAERDISSLVRLGKMTEMLNSPEFREIENHGAAHGLETAMSHTDLDVIKDLTKKEGLLGDIANAPGVKPFLERTEKNSEFLFGKMQRYLKGLGYGRRVANWDAAHPNATEAEAREAYRAFARHENRTWGGLNWTAMGMTKDNLSIMRLAFLAPDWLESNRQVLAQTLTGKGIEGAEARKYVLTALVGGMAATEGLNMILTGHTTDQNPPGHKLEIEVAPHVYVSLLRGGIGEISKLASMVAETGAGGVPRYLQGKLAPFVSAVTALLTNTDYTGRPIVPKRERTDEQGLVSPISGRTIHTKPVGPMAGTYDVLAFLLKRITPIPIAITNLIDYGFHEPNPSWLGALMSTSGLGRYSKGKKEKPKLITMPR